MLSFFCLNCGQQTQGYRESVFFQRLAVLCFTFASPVGIEAVSMKSVPWMSGLFAGGLFVVLVPLLEERLYEAHIAFFCIAYTVSFL